MEIRERILEFTSKKRITIAEFERLSGLGNGYVGKIRNSIGRRKLEDILNAFPDLNRVWLLTGEGEMLNRSDALSVNQSVSDHHGTSVAGNGNNVNATIALEKALESLMEQQKITVKAQEQIDRLLAILERANGSNS